MFTIAYKGGWIHGYIDKDECRVQPANGRAITVKSLHAAKYYLTRWANSPRASAKLA